MCYNEIAVQKLKKGVFSEMSKNIDNDLDYKQAFNKLLDLFMYNEIEESKMFINIISKEIDFKTQMRNQLLCNKPFKFQKKKTEQYNKKLEKLEDEIIQCYKNIEVELKEISRLQNSISHKDNQKINNEIKKNSKISFYDLLSLSYYSHSVCLPFQESLKIFTLEFSFPSYQSLSHV